MECSPIRSQYQLRLNHLDTSQHFGLVARVPGNGTNDIILDAQSWDWAVKADKVTKTYSGLNVQGLIWLCVCI